jgi:hypothetical protein
MDSVFKTAQVLEYFHWIMWDVKGLAYLDLTVRIISEALA